MYENIWQYFLGKSNFKVKLIRWKTSGRHSKITIGGILKPFVRKILIYFKANTVYNFFLSFNNSGLIGIKLISWPISIPK
jgi:hypothetical protein